MAVRQFGRIALGFTWNRLNTELVDLAARGRREYHAVFQLRKEGVPEWIILKHIEDSRNADLSADRFILRQRLVAEDPFVFVFEQVRNMIFVFLFSDTALAAVSADVLTAAGEFVDGQTAAVRTAFAVCHRGRVFQLIDLFDGEHRSLLICRIALSCDQRRTERTHNAGDVRADGFAVGDPLKASENSVVVERTALYDDVASKLGGIRNFNYLI